MAKDKKSFVAYTDWKETFEALPDDKAGQLIKHIFAYVSDEKPQTDDVLINAVFANIKNTLKRDLAKWDKQHQQRIEAGKKSAEIRKRNSTTVERPLNETQQASTVSGSVSGSDSVSKIKEYIYNQFYDSQLKESNNDKSYLRFIEILFGKNEEGEKLKGVLSIRDQLTFKQFDKLLSQKPKDVYFETTLLKIDNDSKYYKGKKRLNTILSNWFEGRFLK
jgi:hypothetical protein